MHDRQKQLFCYFASLPRKIFAKKFSPKPRFPEEKPFPVVEVGVGGGGG